MLVNKKESGIIGADFNCIIDKKDSLRNQEQKISPTLQRLVRVFSLTDSFRLFYPNSQAFSRYYSSENGGGASRLDRFYHYGNININAAKYMGVSFSDHQTLVLKIALDESFSRLLPPKSRPPFKASPDSKGPNIQTQAGREFCLMERGKEEFGFPGVVGRSGKAGGEKVATENRKRDEEREKRRTKSIVNKTGLSGEKAS